MDFSDMTGRAIEADGRQITQVFDLSPGKTDRPAEIRIGNQAERSQISPRKQIGIRLDERAENGFRDNFGAHGAVEEKVEIFGGPLWDLSHVDSGGGFLLRVCVLRREKGDTQGADKNGNRPRRKTGIHHE